MDFEGPINITLFMLCFMHYISKVHGGLQVPWFFRSTRYVGAGA